MKQGVLLSKIVGGIGAVIATGMIARIIISNGGWVWAIVMVPIMWGLLFFGLSLFAGTIIFPALTLLKAVLVSAQWGLDTVEVASRTVGFVDARETALKQLQAAGHPIELPNPTLDRAPWARVALIRRALPYARTLSILSTLAMVALSWHLEFGLPGWTVTAIAGAIFVALMMVPWPNLAEEAATLAADATVSLLQPRERDRGWEVQLPQGGRGVLTRQGFVANPWGLHLSMTCQSLPFDVVPMRTERLEQEEDDLDTGDPLLDRASLLTPRFKDTRNDLCTAWLTPQLRTLLLWALSEGATFEARKLQVGVDLRDVAALARLARLLVMFDAIHAAVNARADTLEARAAHALDIASTEETRVALVEECAQLDDLQMAAGVWRAWALGGRGDTRVAAALYLGAQAYELLGVVARAEDEDAAVRATALVAMMRRETATTCQILARWISGSEAALLLATAQRLAAAKLPSQAEVQHRIAATVKDSRPPAAIAAAVACLVVAGGPQSVQTVTVTALSDTIRSQALSAEALDALRLLKKLSGDSSRDAALHMVHTATIETLARLQTALEGQRGGLSIATDTATAGGLALAD